MNQANIAQNDASVTIPDIFGKPVIIQHMEGFQQSHSLNGLYEMLLDYRDCSIPYGRLSGK
jgi:hypothetical protein